MRTDVRMRSRMRVSAEHHSLEALRAQRNAQFTNTHECMCIVTCIHDVGVHVEYINISINIYIHILYIHNCYHIYLQMPNNVLYTYIYKYVDAYRCTHAHAVH